MNTEKAQANDHALTMYANAVLPEFKSTLKAINDFYGDPSEDNMVEIRKNAPNIRNLWRQVDDIVKALADLKNKMEFSIVSVFNESPEMQQEFKIQKGATSVKCDASPEAMSALMDRFVEAGFNPSALFAQCTAITAKKAADAFGLSQQALLEAHGDLFATHENKPSVRMI